MKKYSSNEENKLFILLTDIINITFPDNKDENDTNNSSYKVIKKCITQILMHLKTESTKNVLTKVNECILYNNNCQYFIEYEKPKKKKIKKTNNEADKDEEKEKEKDKDKEKNKNPSSVPYITKKPDKKFCLILDLDETLVHNLKFNFGDYFLVRPGVFKFLTNIHEIYEIIIFTAAHKRYANNVLDKIDINDCVSHRLYKRHVSYEDDIPVKKLDLIGRDLNKLIFVDNLECTAKYNMKNFCPISTWYSNLYDEEINKLEQKLINIVKCGKYEDDITKGLIKEKEENKDKSKDK